MIRAEGGSRDRGAIVLGREGWHPGVIGIVASRLVDIYHRPTIVVAFGDEFSQGSARSVPGFNLYEAIRDCSEGLIGFGGHAAAAGLKLTEDHFPTFAERFDERCRSALTPEQLQKVLHIDAEVPLGVLTLSVVEEIEKLEPYGIGNPRPLLLASQVRIVGEPRLVGERKNHLQLRLLQGDTQVKAIGWNMAEKGKDLKPNMFCSVVFHPMSTSGTAAARSSSRSRTSPSRKTEPHRAPNDRRTGRGRIAVLSAGYGDRNETPSPEASVTRRQATSSRRSTPGQRRGRCRWSRRCSRRDSGRWRRSECRSAGSSSLSAEAAKIRPYCSAALMSKGQILRRAIAWRIRSILRSRGRAQLHTAPEFTQHRNTKTDDVALENRLADGCPPRDDER